MNTSCCTNPIRINTLLIKNRIVFPAMCTKYAAPDGGFVHGLLPVEALPLFKDPFVPLDMLFHVPLRTKRVYVCLL